MHTYIVSGPPGYLRNALPRRLPEGCEITSNDDGTVTVTSPTELSDLPGPVHLEAS